MTPEQRAAVATEATRALWRRGAAALALLDTSGPTGGQQAWVSALARIPPASWAAWKIARQRGKTFAALVWALQRMGLEPGLSAVYLAQTGGNAQAIAQTFLREVDAGLPPEWGARMTGDGIALANGAELVVFGTDNLQYRRRRGRKARIVLLDEAAFYADLLDVEQVYAPQLQTTGGVGLYLSSPPISLAHAFNDRCRGAMAAGRYTHDSFWNNPRINHEAVIRGECERLGLSREELLASTAFRREYLAEDVTEESRAAVPQWGQAAHDACVVEVPRPPHFDAYTGVDLGFSPDPSALLWGWYDVAAGALVVEEELELRGTTVAGLAAEAKRIEARLWGADRWDGLLLGAERLENLPPWLLHRAHARAPRQPFLRVGDDDALVLAELSASHGYAVLPTRKDDKHMAVDFVGQLVASRRLRIHPRCKRLIEQLYTTVWNSRRTSWERTDRDHGDLLDALVYMARNVAWNRDCRPPPVDALRPWARPASGLEALGGLVRKR